MPLFETDQLQEERLPHSACGILSFILPILGGIVCAV